MAQASSSHALAPKVTSLGRSLHGLTSSLMLEASLCNEFALWFEP